MLFEVWSGAHDLIAFLSTQIYYRYSLWHYIYTIKHLIMYLPNGSMYKRTYVSYITITGQSSDFDLHVLRW